MASLVVILLAYTFPGLATMSDELCPPKGNTVHQDRPVLVWKISPDHNLIICGYKEDGPKNQLRLGAYQITQYYKKRYRILLENDSELDARDFELDRKNGVLRIIQRLDKPGVPLRAIEIFCKEKGCYKTRSEICLVKNNKKSIEKLKKTYQTFMKGRSIATAMKEEHGDTVVYYSSYGALAGITEAHQFFMNESNKRKYRLDGHAAEEYSVGRDLVLWAEERCWASKIKYGQLVRRTKKFKGRRSASNAGFSRP